MLAKRKDIYVPGVIRSSDIANSVLVELDHPEGQREIYHDIFSSGRFDVISDASPSISDVSLIVFFYLDDFVIGFFSHSFSDFSWMPSLYSYSNHRTSNSRFRGGHCSRDFK